VTVHGCTVRSPLTGYRMPSYIKAMPTVLEILKMDGRFADSPRKVIPQPTVICHEACHVLYLNTGLFEMIVGVLTTCHTQ